MNVLVSTTRQWNCGDEFILFGVQKLLSAALAVCGESLNWVLYNRNPDLLGRRTLSNGYKGESLTVYDLIVIAGSPEWSGPPMAQLYAAARKEGRSVMFLGIGAYDRPLNFSDDDQYVLASSPLVICRDRFAQREVARARSEITHVMPCPALFAGEARPRRHQVDKLAIVNQVQNGNAHSIPTSLSDAVYALLGQLRAEGRPAELIAHYIDELRDAHQKGHQARYSYDARDYLSIYDCFDAVITTRLHGAFLAASLGIPSLLVQRDSRCHGAAEQLPLIHLGQPSDASVWLKTTDFGLVRAELAAAQRRHFDKYVSLVESVLKPVMRK